MKRIYLAIIIMIVFLQCYAQRGYWFQSQYIELLKSDSSCLFVQSQVSENIIEPYLSQVKKRTPNGEFVKMKSGCYLLKNMERPQIQNIYISDIYHTNEVNNIIVMPKVSLSLKQGYDITMLTMKYDGILSEANHRKPVYRLNCTVSTSDEVLDVVAKLSQEEGVEWCEPVNMSGSALNPKYSQQYYLKNTGQNGGTPGIDINVEPAWNITSGNPNITVAVIDAGVDNDHEDMANCVLNGYTAGNPSGDGSPTNPNYYSSKGHGVACAGIIGAENNNIGIRGVASGVKILPVNIIPYPADQGIQGFADASDIADAIEWAYPRADVLSCSWSMLYSTDIVNAMDSARINGRNGKGTIVVCSAGNHESNTIAFPASIDGTIAVGAIDRNGYVCTYSNQGGDLTLVAIGGYSDIVTTDRMGNLGDNTISGNDWNYIDTFGGTSAACPQVAGVVALMLSINPDLTESEVRGMLTSSAAKLPNYTYISSWNNETGYGLVNAKAAVLKAMKLSINGPTIPEAFSVYSVNNLPDGFSVSWSWKNSSTIPIVPDSPYTNNCTISNSNKAYIKDTLIATISKAGNVITTIAKNIHTGANFSGTYSQEGGQVVVPFGSPIYHDPIPTTPFADQSYVRVHTVQTFTLTSSMFSSSTLTSEDGSFPTGWNQNGNTITYNYPRLGGPSIPVIGRSNTGYDVYKFTVKVIPDLIDPGLPILSPGNGTLTISLGDELSEDGNLRSTETDLDELAWDVEIVNVLTGDIAYKGSFKGRSQTISTNGWTSGFYVVRIDINGESISRKIYIK